MGDTLAQVVTQGDTLQTECVTSQSVMELEFTKKMTQVTQICRKVPDARARGGEFVQMCVTVRSASPLNWMIQT